MLDLETLDVETASVLLGRFAVKQAAARVKQAEPTAKQDAGYFGPLMSSTLGNAGIGALGGAGIGALLTALQRKKKKDWLTNILFGAAGGAGLGGAYGAFTGMPAPKSIGDRAAGVEGSKALQTQLGLPDNFTKQDLEAKLQSPDPATRAAAEQMLTASGYSVNTEPGALSEGGANVAGNAAKGAVIGAVVNATGAPGAATRAAWNYGKSKLPLSDAAVTEALKKNPQLPNFFQEAAGTNAAEKDLITMRNELAASEAAMREQALQQPEKARAAFIKDLKEKSGYVQMQNRLAAQEQLLAAAKAREASMGRDVQAATLKPVRDAGLFNKIRAPKAWELRDSTGADVTQHVGGPDKLKALVADAQRQVKAAPPVPSANATPKPGYFKGMLGRGGRGGLAGGIAGSIAGPIVEGLFNGFGSGNGQ